MHKAESYAIPAVWHLFTHLCDTVYVTGDRYIDVSLEEQRVVLRYRNGDTASYPISSGNRFVRDGMETPTGIYSVQGKSPMAVSKQFDDAKLHSWIGFNGNIGFHGLDGNGYYRTLGVRPSSHGCVRMGREDIKKLYKEVRTGTPVIVHSWRPARVLAFADTTFDKTRALRIVSRTKEHTRSLNKRLELLYAGRLCAAALPPVYMDDTTRLRPGGYDVGRLDRVSLYHERPAILPPGLRPRLASDRLAIRTALTRVVPGIGSAKQDVASQKKSHASQQ